MTESLAPQEGNGIVAQTVTHFRDTGIVIPPSWRGIIGRNANALLQAGFDEGTVGMAAVLAVRRGAPQLMQYIAGDIMLARSGQHLDRKEYERQLADFREVGDGPPRS